MVEQMPNDILVALNRLFIRSVLELGNAGLNEIACRLAGEGWALLRHDNSREAVGLPRFRGEVRSGLGIRVSNLTAFCPPLLRDLLVRPRASFRPGLHVPEAVVSSGCQGRPAG